MGPEPLLPRRHRKPAQAGVSGLWVVAGDPSFHCLVSSEVPIVSNTALFSRKKTDNFLKQICALVKGFVVTGTEFRCVQCPPPGNSQRFCGSLLETQT